MENLPAKPDDLSDLAITYLADEFTADKLVKFTVGQGSPEKGKVGHFNGSDGRSLETIENVSFISKNPSRALFYGYGARNKNARCASDDAINPATDRLELQPLTSKEMGGCAECPMGMWSSDGQERDIWASELKEKLAKELGYKNFESSKPLCQYIENLLFLDDTGAPFVLQVAKHNSKESERLMTLVKTLAMRMKAPGWALQFTLGLKPIDGPGNRHLITFSQSKDWKSLSLEQAKDRQFTVKLLKSSGQKMIADKHAAQDAQHFKEARETQPQESQEVPF
jgi:hypothetical protein